MGSSKSFAERHIGPNKEEIQKMLSTVSADSLDRLIKETVPESIRFSGELNLPQAMSEEEALEELSQYAASNEIRRSYIGQGYYRCHVPEVVKRCILENPCWYTQYTPYQAEIAQGRLEALLNFQTMVSELTGMELANSSLLDEGTAVAEAMGVMLRRAKKAPEKQKIAYYPGLFAQSFEVLQTRARSLQVELCPVTDPSELSGLGCSGVILQTPSSDGSIIDVAQWSDASKKEGALLAVASDLMALCVLRPPGELGADIVVGSSQRFGVPMGYGGPHAAFIATRADFQREIPGRLVGISKDESGNPAYRLALQTREQHIKRERATSNICTAQVLLAIMSSMYAVYHGPKGLLEISKSIAEKCVALRRVLETSGVKVLNSTSFDTLTIEPSDIEAVVKASEEKSINIFLDAKNNIVRCSLDEATRYDELPDLAYVISGGNCVLDTVEPVSLDTEVLESALGQKVRKSAPLSHSIFSEHHSETKLLRYITRLQNRDLSLAHSMIPLGSCTMKLNAASEMVPVTWSAFSQVHPFTPCAQVPGYQRLVQDLENYLGEITALPAVSLQPNAGSQGEYAGLTTIRAYFKAKGEEQSRNICLIPSSAHGTNPASAQMAGLEVKIIRCDDQGNVDVEDLKAKVEQFGEHICALMITYPSTHGVFEESITEICDLIHSVGGRVYMDGANMNAQVGICRPGDFGVDICHLNLHKTFCIPHGGGGPGIGPIAAVEDLREYLPGHEVYGIDGSGAVAAAPYGSAGILVIPWMYIRMMGKKGLKQATEIAILNANYVAEKLSKSYSVLYTGSKGRVAHECIIDLRTLKRELGVTVTDIAKRLIDYSFHAPTVSFPVAETMMIEPTESEDLGELDRFCDAMLSIAKEIEEIKNAEVSYEDSVLRNAPHTIKELSYDSWDRAYSKQKAVYPREWVSERKFWSPVQRIDNAYGDRNLFCVCPDLGEYE